MIKIFTSDRICWRKKNIKFQTIVFVVRDYKSSEECSYGFEGGMDYLKTILEASPSHQVYSTFLAFFWRLINYFSSRFLSFHNVAFDHLWVKIFERKKDFYLTFSPMNWKLFEGRFKVVSNKHCVFYYHIQVIELQIVNLLRDL